jgi:hypothetical protein
MLKIYRIFIFRNLTFNITAVKVGWKADGIDINSYIWV